MVAFETCYPKGLVHLYSLNWHWSLDIQRSFYHVTIGFYSVQLFLLSIQAGEFIFATGDVPLRGVTGKAIQLQAALNNLDGVLGYYCLHTEHRVAFE